MTGIDESPADAETPARRREPRRKVWVWMTDEQLQLLHDSWRRDRAAGQDGVRSVNQWLGRALERYGKLDTQGRSQFAETVPTAGTGEKTQHTWGVTETAYMAVLTRIFVDQRYRRHTDISAFVIEAIHYSAQITDRDNPPT